MNALRDIQKWYHSQCNGIWEHGDGIHIGTLDNPGWHVKIMIGETNLKDKPFTSIVRIEPELTWVRCWVEGGVYNGAGGPQQLEEILEIFLTWTKQI